MIPDSEKRGRHLGMLVPLVIFAITMAYLESAVVVYLREAFYPGGFDFPLKEAEPWIFIVEVGRELATLLMLGAVAWVAGAPGWGRFACFAFLFGAWDIWYYIWLKLFLNWPESLLTWDVLFLIPVVWIGPVLAPVLISLLLILGSLRAMQLLDRGATIRIDSRDWTLATAGALAVIYSFTEDILSIIIGGGLQAVFTFVPQSFGWPLFLLGFALMAFTAVRIEKNVSRIS